MAYFFGLTPPANDLSNRSPLNLDQLNTGRGLFIPAAKFYAVTILLWLCLASICSFTWIGAFVVGMKIAKILAVSL